MTSAGPLSDLLVLDFTRALAGPHAAMMLGDLGARVIKVEHPDGGDDARNWGPPFVEAPVVLENFLPGVLDRLGLGMGSLARLNPRLVMLSISGFGHDGPEGGRPGYDQIAQGEAGLMSVTGPDADHPQRVGVPIADLLAGIYGAYGILAALRERDHTGRGPPGPPLRTFLYDTSGLETETTATGHRAPPTLDADGGAIRDWLSWPP
jgi:crotonobetainyl-CoA:carnitine CoA-transferase CaiB-like acyl-CoA transferase